MQSVTVPDNRPLPFYLALEEVVARRYPEVDGFFAWRVKPTVIIGRNQLIANEVDITHCKEQGIHLIRRKSGGGAVYADEGNLMFSYILTDSDTAGAFRRAMQMTADVLCAAGIPAELSGRNDVLVDGRKVSGAALYRIGTHCIIHNTLLFQTDIDRMERALTPPAEKLAGRGVASVRSRVLNIGERTGMTIDEFADFARRQICDATPLTLSEDELAVAGDIAARLADPSFVLGRTPRQKVLRKARIPGAGILEAYLDIRDGVLEDINLAGDFFVLGELDTDLLDQLRGLPFRKDAFAQALDGTPINEIIRGLTADDFLQLLFGEE